MKIQGTEKQEKWATDILKEYRFQEKIDIGLKKTFENTSYKKDESFQKAKDSLNKINNLIVNASLIIDLRNDINLENFIMNIAKEHNIICNFLRLLI